MTVQIAKAPPRDLIQSVARALSILEVVGRHRGPIRAQQVQAASDLHLATAYHLLNTLVYAGYLSKDRAGYSLSSKVAELYSALSRDLHVDPATILAMHRLVESTDETVYASLWHQGDAWIAAVAEGTQPVRVGGVHVGLRGNAYARASGKALLTFGPPLRVEDYLAKNELQALTANTNTSRLALLQELEEVRARGYAMDEEEFVEGVCCIAAPVLDSQGWAQIALTVTIPATRFNQVADRAIRALLDETQQMARSSSR